MLENYTLHSKIGCSFCVKAKALLDNLSVPYKEVVYDPAQKGYEKKAAALIAQTGHRTFPQIFVDHQFIGGFEELKKLLHKPSFLTKQVVKRNGHTENMSLDKIVRRIDFLANFPSVLKGINAVDLAQSISPSVYDGILTQDIDELITAAAAERGSDEPDYLTFAARLAVNNLHKKTLTSFKDKMELLYRNVDKWGVPFQLIDKRFFEFVCRNQKEIEQVIDYRRDYSLDYFGLRTLEKGYLLKATPSQAEKAVGKVVERPQDMWMRVSIFLHYRNHRVKTTAIEKLRLIFECYDMMSQKLFTHASPTLFNAGTVQSGCISCFLLDTDDSTEGIMHVNKAFALVSKSCGGVGFSASKWRAKNSVIRGTNGRTLGIVPFMQMLEATGRAFNQSSKREGKLAIYLDTHHPDIISFLRTKLNTGNEQQYCKDISIALWVSDLFMKRVRDNAVWSLFNPLYQPELLECYGEEYERLYEELEEKGLYESQLPARKVWQEICLAQASSGMPYILFKDQINRTSNQKNVGIVRTSNLCSEITEVSEYKDSEPNKAEFACCTLASIALPEFVDSGSRWNVEPSLLPNKFEVAMSGTRLKETIIPNAGLRSEDLHAFDYDKLEKVVKVVVRNLNNVIDDTYYPTKEAERSNKRHRPLGVGVQGLSDVFAKFRFAYESEEAAKLNAAIFEHFYYYALKASNELAREIYEAAKKAIEEAGEVVVDKRKYTKLVIDEGSIIDPEVLPATIGAYSTFEGSPLAQGVLNFDHYAAPRFPLIMGEEKWNELRANVVKYGVRNSLLIALMPTASTSNLLDNTEGFEPRTNNVMVRVTLSGEYLVVNKYLVAELKELGLWTAEIIGQIKTGRGSVATIEAIPTEVRERYKTCWETSQRTIIELAADRQRFVCQSQSMNLHFSQLSLSKFTTAMFLGWEKGLKTGVYYLRSQSASKPDTAVITGSGTAPDCCSA